MKKIKTKRSLRGDSGSKIHKRGNMGSFGTQTEFEQNMKPHRKFMTIALLAAAFCVSLSFSAARADDDEQGGEIEGTEDLEFEVQMTPMAAAPPRSVNVVLRPKLKAGTIAPGINLLQIKSATLTDRSGNVLLKFNF
jgi:hypothetical protein